MRSCTLVLFTASILALPACGDKPEETTSLSSGTADTTTGVLGPTSTTGPMSGSTTTPDDTTAGSNSGDTTPTTTGSSTGSTTGATTEPVDTTTTDATTDATTASTTDATTAEPGECALLGAMECQANAACQAVEGGKLNLEKMCVGKTMFLGCIAAGACGEAETIGCAPDADPTEPHLFPSTCLPPDWQPCEAPATTMPCK